MEQLSDPSYVEASLASIQALATQYQPQNKGSSASNLSSHLSGSSAPQSTTYSANLISGLRQLTPTSRGSSLAAIQAIHDAIKANAVWQLARFELQDLWEDYVHPDQDEDLVADFKAVILAIYDAQSDTEPLITDITPFARNLIESPLRALWTRCFFETITRYSSSSWIERGDSLYKKKAELLRHIKTAARGQAHVKSKDLPEAKPAKDPIDKRPSSSASSSIIPSTSTPAKPSRNNTSGDNMFAPLDMGNKSDSNSSENGSSSDSSDSEGLNGAINQSIMSMPALNSSTTRFVPVAVPPNQTTGIRRPIFKRLFVQRTKSGKHPDPSDILISKDHDVSQWKGTRFYFGPSDSNDCTKVTGKISFTKFPNPFKEVEVARWCEQCYHIADAACLEPVYFMSLITKPEIIEAKRLDSIRRDYPLLETVHDGYLFLHCLYDFLVKSYPDLDTKLKVQAIHISFKPRRPGQTMTSYILYAEEKIVQKGAQRHNGFTAFLAALPENIRNYFLSTFQAPMPTCPSGAIEWFGALRKWANTIDATELIQSNMVKEPYTGRREAKQQDKQQENPPSETQRPSAGSKTDSGEYKKVPYFCRACKEKHLHGKHTKPLEKTGSSDAAGTSAAASFSVPNVSGTLKL